MKKLLCAFLLVCLCSLLCIQSRTAVSAAIPQTVSAKSCIVMEAVTRQVLFAQNAEEKLPMASTTKIMTTLLCLESGDLDTEFVVDADAIQVEGSSMGLTVGDIVTRRALCYGMLLPSGNDAANAVAVTLAGSQAAFAEKMNRRAAAIGMQHTHFVTPSGLHDDKHYSTAYDMALLTAEALQNPDFCEICKQSSAKVCFGNPPFERWLKNTNKLLTQCEGVIGVKTGFTDEAGRCLVSACERNGITLICVTLNDRNDWQTHTTLYDTIFPTLCPKTVTLPETVKIPVVGSQQGEVMLVPKKEILYGVQGTAEPELCTEIHRRPFVFAPVRLGQTAGWMVLKNNRGETLVEVPLCVMLP